MKYEAASPDVLPDRIATRDDLEMCLDALRANDPMMREALFEVGEVPLRLRASGYEGMAQIIVGQMVSKASASAIVARLEDALGEVTGANLLAAGREGLDGVGLSRAKFTALENLAVAERDGEIDLHDLCHLPPDDAMGKMVALKGIGPWTAQVYLMFCAGHRDVFADGDIALQQAMVDLGLVAERPKAKEAAMLAQRWKPVRAVAARVLWAVYAKRRSRVDLPV
ncbi:DNA-3-methyladenine glycosylase family protein [Pseudahrensia aquimaris]|uniref:DNA-3-methyladenine glycosylase II n=1 Tax=Pseudahrensia aquimaris TaxID=744461 RepID=A0ABW3FCE7_9HYPH